MDIYTLAYKSLVKPIGELISKSPATCNMLDAALCYKNNALNRTVKGIAFENPIGLAAGFDYNGKLVGFGFNTVGTVTARQYEGNTPPRLIRLPKSKSILVNKGFKNEGIHKIAERLNNNVLENTNFGVSVGSSNVTEVDSVKKAIDDYLESFSVLEKIKYVKYYELNISCPNTKMAESFVNEKNFTALLDAIKHLNLKRPIFIKMPNETDIYLNDTLIKLSMKRGTNTFIFSNLVKDRNNPYLNRSEIASIRNLKGNFSGLPTKINSTNRIKTFREKYGDEVVLIGCGGLFSPQDAIEKFLAGADLVQLITGMIYEGPGLIGNINKELPKSGILAL